VQDIFEQLVTDYLHVRGYFTRHNVKFRPNPKDHDYEPKKDSNFSDIDVIGLNPLEKSATDRVWVVSCKSWQSGFVVERKVSEIKAQKIVAGKEAWKAFRELTKRKWTVGFFAAVKRCTGSTRFTYVTAVTKIKGDRSRWEENPHFRKAMRGNPIKLLTLEDMVKEIMAHMTTTLASSSLSRTLQLLKETHHLSIDHAVDGKSTQR